MATTNPPTDAPFLPRGAALIPSPHDTRLASAARPMLDALAQATEDLTLTVTGGGRAGEMRISAPTLRFIFAAVSEIARGRSVSLLPLHEEVTTQQAADLLNVSRPYLVALLEKGEMPFRKVGNQRRVRLQD